MTPGACRSALARRARRSPTCAAGWTRSGSLPSKTLPLLRPATRTAVEAFQHRRGLKVDGVCGHQTWNTLVEAGLSLGDRTLWRRTPMLRGDDVAELQQRLGALGFDTGRVDGIFGRQTAEALAEFQRNAGLPPTGSRGRPLSPSCTACSCATAFPSWSRPCATGSGCATPRRRWSAPPGHRRERRPGHHRRALRRKLVAAGARVISLHHPDGSAQAHEANAVGAEVYIGLRLDPGHAGCSTSFYSGYAYESPGAGAWRADPVPGACRSRRARRRVTGMSVPVLRETQMPAVIVEVGPASAVVERGPVLADALLRALVAWATTSWTSGSLP